MKKSLSLIVLVFLSLSLASALDITFSKSNYYPGETLQAEFADIFTSPLQVSNIGIYKTDGVHKMPGEIGFFRYQGKYYLYSMLSNLEGDYILKIENIAHYENTGQSQTEIIKNFSIISTNTSYLSLNPGQVQASADFKVNIRAYNSPQSVSAEFTPSNFKQTFTLNQGLDKNIYVPISSIISETFASLKINNYVIQVLVTPKTNPPENDTNQTLPIEFDQSLSELIDVSPSEIDATILPKFDYYYRIILFNNIGYAIDNVSIHSSNTQAKITSNFTYIPEDKREINLTINTDKDFIGNITLTRKNTSIIIPLNIKITSNKSNVNSSIRPINMQKTCQNLGGVICNISNSESCVGTESTSINGICCIGECKIPAKSSAWIWGIVLLIFLGIGGWLLYKKSKLGQNSDKSREVLQKRATDYEKRIAPTEVKRSLEKI